MEENLKEVQEISEETTSDTQESTYTDEEINDNQQAYDKAIEMLAGLGLEWTFRSIQYIVEKRGVTFNQLRSCLFKVGEKDYQYDLAKATRLIVEAGLVGSKQDAGTNLAVLENKAWDILEKWREDFGFIGIMHILTINTMESKHFFIGQDEMKVVQHLHYKNLQKDLAQNLVAQDLSMKMNQAQALQ